MILIDTSVWIDHFNGRPTWEANLLADALQTTNDILLGDIILLELLQGAGSDRQSRQLENALLGLKTVELIDIDLARLAASHYRVLRAQGVTPRKTTDLIIGTWCIAHDCELLHRDRDFVPMQRHLGLRNAAPAI